MHSLIVRNTLLSPAGLNKIILLPHDDGLYASLSDVVTKFQDIKKFASEIHTETHLVKPILKLLGYACESKPKFFEDHIKGPDAALFTSDAEQTKSSQLWGTQEYYANTLALVLLKRYGRNLEEGISGFYLEFENRIPTYQTAYLLKKTKSPWGILTNGKHWILMKRPFSYEIQGIAIDLEKGLFEENHETFHLFYNIFSLQGLTKTLPEILEEERTGLISLLQEKKSAVRKSIHGLRKKVEVFPKAIDVLQTLFPDRKLSTVNQYLMENNVVLGDVSPEKPGVINEHRIANISAYLFDKKGYRTDYDLESVFFKNGNGSWTKEQMLSLKILDMTPNFGNMAAALVDGLAYLSFLLPYGDRNTFIAEWENETSLKRFIIDNLLFGIEKSYLAFDILQNMMQKRFNTEARNYRFGNPLIGTSLADVPAHFDTRNQLGLFNKNPEDVLNTYRSMYKQYFGLSEKIREDLQMRQEMEPALSRYTDRMNDAMDLITSTYFSKAVDNRRLQDVLANLESDESTWTRMKSQEWFLAAKSIARRNAFFHFEIGFPFLLVDAFDYIFVQPALQHIWEDSLPFLEVAKAYIKRGMSYLKPGGNMVLILDDYSPEELAQELSQSKRFDVEASKDVLFLTKKQS